MVMLNKHLVIQSFDNQPLVQFKEFKFLINPLTEQIPATSTELLQAATDWIVEEGDFNQATKIGGEEDKAAILVSKNMLTIQIHIIFFFISYHSNICYL